MDVIVSHVNADFDSLGGMVGAARLYPGAVMVLPGGENKPVREFLTLHRELFAPVDASEIDPVTITRVVVVDTCSRRRLGPAAAWIELPEVEVHVFDHHVDLPCDLPTSLCRVEARGAVSTLLVEALQVENATVGAAEATAMLLGIYEDTGSLSYAGTTPEDLRAAAWLLAAGGDLDIVSRFTRHPLTAGQRRLFREALDHLEIREVRGAQVGIAEPPEGSFVEDAAVVAHRILDLEELDAVLLLARMEGTLFAIGRSRTDAIDIGAALQELGGGGHARAASLQLPVEEAASFRGRLEAAIARHAAPEPTARDIMSQPVRTVTPDVPISEARQRMVRYGHSGLVVTEREQLVGVLTRRDADRAFHHQMDHSPVGSLMTRDVCTIPPEASLSRMEKLMIREGIGRLPVVSDGRVMGIVTRTDLLVARHGSAYLAGTHPEDPESPAQLLRSQLPAAVQRLLEEIGRVAEREGQQVFLVGGIVRDLLLHTPNTDIDLLVEPDGIALARAVAEELGGTWKDKRFGTARVVLPDGLEVEFSSARTESYSQPGALPDVEPSSIRDDLRRRDFTVNAMALALRPSHFGELIDPFSGRRDLDRRQLRVLHNLSFAEDPTRLFRAVRFEERFHFRMDRHTEELARIAVRNGALERISPERLRTQLFDTFREKRAVGCLLRLAELGVLEWLAPGLAPDVPLLQRLPGAIEWWSRAGNAAIEPPLVWLAALLAPLGHAPAGEVASRRFRLSPADRRTLEVAITARDRRQELLDPRDEPSHITRRLTALPAEAFPLLRAGRASSPQPDDRERAAILERYVNEWRKARLAITGTDLLEGGAKPGPAVGRALEATRDALLDGKVEDRHSQLEYARSMLQQEDLPPGSETI